jgi:putative endopeptidase
MKDKVNECGEEVRDYYREMLKNETWLSEATRTAAIDKLNRMTIHSVIPEKTVDYSSLELKNAKNGGSFLDAILSISKFETQLDKSHINAKVDPDLWDSPTSEVNAYYDPSKNAVYFLAGQLVPPLLDDENNYEEFLALVGSTFGHEISHAFDTNGAQYDAYGNLKNWWTDADQAAFQDRTQKVVDYLDSITPFSDKPDLHIDGELVKTEYIADLVSFKPLFAIAEKHPGFNYDLFFQAYSVQWRLLSSQENEISQAQNDEHPLNYLRVNAILPQYQQFYDTYGIMPGDGMYIDQDDRLEVW